MRARCGRRLARSVLHGRGIDERVAVVGHSFGAATAIGVAAEDPRVRACVMWGPRVRAAGRRVSARAHSLDPWMLPVDAAIASAGLRMPVLCLCGDEFSKWAENLAPLKWGTRASRLVRCVRHAAAVGTGRC